MTNSVSIFMTTEHNEGCVCLSVYLRRFDRQTWGWKNRAKRVVSLFELFVGLSDCQQENTTALPAQTRI